MIFVYPTVLLAAMGTSVRAVKHSVALSWLTESFTFDQLRIGDIVELKGVENPSTGYSWSMTPEGDTAIYTVLTNTYQRIPPPSMQHASTEGLVGVPG